MAQQIAVRLVLFLIAWALYTLISDAGFKIDNVEAILFGLVVSSLGPQIFGTKKQVTDSETVVTLGQMPRGNQTPRVFWICWATWAIALVVLSILFWPNWQSDEKWSYIMAAGVMGGGWVIEKIVR